MTVLQVKHSPRAQAIQWTGTNTAEIESYALGPVTLLGDQLFVEGNPNTGTNGVLLNQGDYFIVRTVWPGQQWSAPDLTDWPEV